MTKEFARHMPENISDQCQVSSGVKQGGCLSLSLFNVCLNNLCLNF